MSNQQKMDQSEKEKRDRYFAELDAMEGELGGALVVGFPMSQKMMARERRSDRKP